MDVAFYRDAVPRDSAPPKLPSPTVSFQDSSYFRDVPSFDAEPQPRPIAHVYENQHRPAVHMHPKHDGLIDVPLDADAYELLEVIGKGGSAKVWEALCRPLNMKCAIKIVDLEKLGENLDAVLKEAHTMAALRHPNLVPLFGSFVHGASLWMVMPYQAGGSVLTIMQYEYPTGLPEPTLVAVMRQVLEGLQYMHSQHFIHRDVKGSNILVDGDGVVRLGDLGVAAHCESTGPGGLQLLRKMSVVGTASWMAPEVIEQARGYMFEADMWSFGITFLELAYGKAPLANHSFMDVAMHVLRDAPPALENDGEHEFSKAAQEVVAMCLEPDVSRRATAAELLKHKLFKTAHGPSYIVKHLLEGLPDVAERLRMQQEAEPAGGAAAAAAAGRTTRQSARNLAGEASKSKKVYRHAEVEAMNKALGFGAPQAVALLQRLSRPDLYPPPVVSRAPSRAASRWNSQTNLAAYVDAEAEDAPLKPAPPLVHEGSSRNLVGMHHTRRLLDADALWSCQGLVFFHIRKSSMGFLSHVVGTGFVVVKLPQSSPQGAGSPQCEGGDGDEDVKCLWSAPCYISLDVTRTGGLGIGFEELEVVVTLDSAEVAAAFRGESVRWGRPGCEDCDLHLYEDCEVHLMSHNGQQHHPHRHHLKDLLHRSADNSPRPGSSSVAASMDRLAEAGRRAARLYGYSLASGGIHTDLHLTSAVTTVNDKANQHLIGRPVSAEQLLTGEVPPPLGFSPLYDELNALMQRSAGGSSDSGGEAEHEGGGYI